MRATSDRRKPVHPENPGTLASPGTIPIRNPAICLPILPSSEQYKATRMRARRLTQWAPHFRAPARSQWRSGPAPPVGRFSSSNAPHGKRRPRRAAQAVPQPSIFEQLFPPETLPPSHARAPDLKTSRSRDGEVTGVGGEVGEDARLERGDAAVWERMREEEEEEEWNGPREEAILVVRNGSKSTLPSDFYRVAPRGEHLDGRGWSSMQGS